MTEGFVVRFTSGDPECEHATYLSRADAVCLDRRGSRLHAPHLVPNPGRAEVYPDYHAAHLALVRFWGPRGLRSPRVTIVPAGVSR